MIIRCPHCEFTRSISEDKIPPSAETATCPKCRNRFRFRTLDNAEKEQAHPTITPERPTHAQPNAPLGKDIWSAVESLSQRWENDAAQAAAQTTKEASTTPTSYTDAPVDDSLHSEAMPASQQEEEYPSEQEPSPITPEEAMAAAKAAALARKKNKRSFASLLDSLPLFSASKQTNEKEAAPADKKAEQHAIDRIKVPVFKTPDTLREEEPEQNILQEESAPAYASKHALATLEETHQACRSSDYTTKTAPSALHTPVQPSPPVAFSTKAYSAPQEPAALHKKEPRPSESPLAGEKAQTSIQHSAATQEENCTSSAMDPAAQTPLIAAPSVAVPSVAHFENSELTDTSTEPDAEEQPSSMFPSYDDTPPEERVDNDMKTLFTTQARPTRDLGRIEDYMPEIDGKHVEYGSATGDIPWEAPEKLGWFKAYSETVCNVMFKAPTFFPKISNIGPLSMAFLFFLLQGYLAIINSLLWAHLAGIFLDNPLLQTNTASLPLLLLLAPLALGLMLILASGGMRLVLDLFSPQRVPFPLVFKTVCYAFAPLSLSVVPFIGPLAGSLWFFAVLVIAGRSIFSLSWIASALSTLPAVVILVAGLCVFFL